MDFKINGAMNGYFNQNVSKINGGDTDHSVSKTEKKECETCENRTYVDGSDDPGVSFKTPKKVSRNAARAAVFAHEMEHFTREGAKAKREGREVLSNRIQMKTAICPECGSPYVAGGKTTTVTARRNEEEKNQFKEQFEEMAVGAFWGKYFDEKQ